ncbi:MAG: hypothetical protein JXA30_12310 [Deltaproteobacteria bacterium]|nr:hypothetical protein [Deltaproteobacteria bacterium]
MRLSLFCLALLSVASGRLVQTGRVYADEPWARPNRLAFSLGFNASAGDLGAFHDAVEQYRKEIGARNPQLQIGGSLKSDWVFGPELCGRYYFPYYFWAELGFGYLYNGASADLEFTYQAAVLSYGNHLFEMPLLVGGYYPIDAGIYLFAGVGPTLVIYSLSRWVYSRGRVASYSTTLGGGFHLQAGADIRLTDAVSLSPAFRFRYMKTAELHPSDPPYPPLLPAIDLDMSGIGVTISARWFVL